ncbi:hypothetical protein V2J09_005668 [Rumex salicifolius]
MAREKDEEEGEYKISSWLSAFITTSLPPTLPKQNLVVHVTSEGGIAPLASHNPCQVKTTGEMFPESLGSENFQLYFSSASRSFWIPTSTGHMDRGYRSARYHRRTMMKDAITNTKDRVKKVLFGKKKKKKTEVGQGFEYGRPEVEEGGENALIPYKAARPSSYEARPTYSGGSRNEPASSVQWTRPPFQAIGGKQCYQGVPFREDFARQANIVP